jgi:hypothetical protein
MHELLDFMEERYIEMNGGDKSGAAKALHMADGEGVVHRKLINSVISGIMFGATITCIVVATLAFNFLDGQSSVNLFEQVTSKLPGTIMAITGMGIMMVALFAVNIIVWDEVGVNYAYLYELDERCHWNGPALLRQVMKYGVVWGVCAVAQTTYASSEFMQKVSGPYLVLGGFSILFVWDLLVASNVHKLLRPVPWLSNLLRDDDELRGNWFITRLFRIALTPMYPVPFGDYFVCDVFTSMTGFFGSIQTLFLVYFGLAPNFTFPILASMPHISRIMQCFRRYYDQENKRELHPNLSNAGKYLAGVASIVTSWSFTIAYNEAQVVTRTNRTEAITTIVGNRTVVVAYATVETATTHTDWAAAEGMFILWLVAALVEYLYKTPWDIYMDGAVFRCGWHVDGKSCPTKRHRFLRQRLLYGFQWYWVFIVADIVLRAGTVVRVIGIRTESFLGKLDPLVYWVAEIIRRFIWCFFRLENEQVNNIEHYREVDIVPPAWSAGESVVLKDNMDSQFAGLWTNVEATAPAEEKEEDGDHKLEETSPVSGTDAEGTPQGPSDGPGMVMPALPKKPPKTVMRPAPVPTLSSLFDRLPLHHQHGALAAFYKERLDTSDVAEDVWSFTREDCNDFFNTMHHEDQVRILFFAIGHETVEGFLKRFPAERKDFVADIGAVLGSTAERNVGSSTGPKAISTWDAQHFAAAFMRDGSVTFPSTYSETEQGSIRI